MNAGFKNSGIAWIGDVPFDWTILKMKHYSYMKGRIGWQGLTADEFTEEGPYLVTGTDFDRGRVCWERSYHISEKRYGEAVPIQLRVGDLLVTKDGTIGKLAYIDELPGKASLNSHLLVIRPVGGKYINRFLYWVLGSTVFQGFYEIASYGSTMDSLTQEKIGEFEFYVPSISEQHAIATFLDAECGKIDSIIDDLERQIQTLKTYQESVINETVSKGLNPSATYTDSNVSWIGEIPEHWRIKKLRYLGALQNGISKDADSFGSGFPFVSYGDVYNNRNLPKTVKGLVESTAAERRLFSVQYGDVFFTRTSETIEEIGIASTALRTIDDATFAGFLIRFRPTTEELYPGYSKYYFRAEMLRRYFVKEMMIVTRASLGQNLLKNLPVLLPPIDEQKEISRFLDHKCAEIDAMIAYKQRQLTDIRQCRQSLIFEYVTGKKRVKEASSHGI